MRQSPVLQKPSLLLHIGTHKTGSTSIQEMIHVQQEDLRQCGIEPWVEEGAVNAYRLAHAVLRAELATPMRLRYGAGIGQGMIPAFHDWALRLKSPLGMVSSEAFCFLRTHAEQRALITLFTECFASVTVVVGFRSRIGWQWSWERQIDKMGCAAQIAACPDPQRVTADWYFDTIEIQKFWSEIGAVRIMDYDAEVARCGSILPCFLSAIGVGDIPLRRNYRRNVSPR